MINIPDIIITAIKREMTQRIDEKGFNQNRLSEELGITQPQLSSALNGYGRVGIRFLTAVLANRPEWVDLLRPGNGATGPQS